MKGKISIKTVIVLVILVLVGVLAVLGVGAVQTYMSGAAAGSDAKNVLATPGDDGKTAIVVWSTDKAAQGVVEYGTSPASLLLRSLEADPTTDHRVSLSPLKSNTSYYFRIRIGDQVYDNSGIPYSFKTKAGMATPAAVVVPTVALVPTSAVSTLSGCDHTTDYNKDGVVNSIDYITCMKNGGGAAPTMAPAITVLPTGSNSCAGIDFDHNGVINSVDMIKCLQSKK